MRHEHTGRRSKSVRIAIRICIALLILVLVVNPIVNAVVYGLIFNRRVQTPAAQATPVSAFPGLRMESCAFPSDEGQMLVGYRYSAGSRAPKGLIVMAHGIGGGHAAYRRIAAAFAQGGYLVFAYDATGTDGSEGSGIGGLPQGVIDLDYALRFVDQDSAYRDLPVVVFGHSWGAYSAGAVLAYHPEVCAAVLASGFDRSADMLRLRASDYVGPLAKLMLPYVRLHERIRFGDYAGASVSGGLRSSKAAALIIQGGKDDVVPAESGYSRYYAEFANDARFRFLEYPDRGHGDIFDAPSGSLDTALMDEILDFCDGACGAEAALPAAA